MKTDKNPRTDRLYTILESSEDFIKFWGRFVYVEDKRSGTMPTTEKGLIIGITLDKVLLRVNNIMTSWYPINHDKLEFFIDEKEEVNSL